MRTIRIGNRAVGAGCPCFVIAEAGVNHNGRLSLARRMVDAAAQAGANAVKFQTFQADRLASGSARKAAYQIKSTGTNGTQRAMLKALELSAQSHRELQARCRERGILFLSTPFDEESADFLESLGVAAYKISSGDLTNHPLIAHVARKGKPVILSTGMATISEVAAAVAAAKPAANRLILLQCTSNYPADPARANLRVMHTYEKKFRVPAGYSDHTLGIHVAIAAAALGASVIEKHFTLDRMLPGPDQRVSLEPDALAEMVAAIRSTERALGDGAKAPASSELPMRLAARKSLHWLRDGVPGQKTVAADFIALRPGAGIPPFSLDNCIGRTIARKVRAGALVQMVDFRGGRRA